MKSLRICLILILLFCIVSSTIAQNIILSELGTQKQLPMAQVFRAFQDSEGYMWYGTEGGGLCRDDGYTITVFRSDFNTPHLLESNWITCITEDNEHKVWFGTKRGLYILDKKDYSITPFEDKEIERWAIDAILSASDGTIWVSAGNRMFHYDLNQGKIDSYIVKWNGEAKSVSQIYEDSTSGIWIVQWQGGVFRFNPDENDFTSYLWPFIESPTCIIQDHYSDGYWISTWGKGIVYFNPSSEKVEDRYCTDIYFDKSHPSMRYIHGLLQDDAKHYLWTITTDNLYVYESSRNRNLSLAKESAFLSLEKKALNQIISDKEGNIWIPSYYPHTFIASFLQNRAVRYTVPQMQEEFGHPASPATFLYDNEHYWFYQRRTGMYVCDLKNDKLLPISQFRELRGKKISALLEKSKNGEGVFTVINDTIVMKFKYDKAISSESVISLPYNDRIHTLHEDFHSNLWIGTSDNLFKYDLRSHILSNVLKDIGIVNDIIVTSDQKVILATEKQGLCIVQSDNVLCNYNKEEHFSTITEAPDHTIWAGTQQGNVYHCSPNGNELLSVTTDCALNGDAILAIESDNQGYIWILTDQRIVIYNPATKSTNVIHNSDPSILMNNFLSLHKDKEGVIHVGGTGGFYSFPDYDGFDIVDLAIPASLSSVKVNGNIRLTGYGEQVITLQPNEQNVELFFTTFNHLSAKNTRYAFRYDDGQEYWNYLPEGQNNIFITGLAKGEYVLDVKATDQNGHWGNSSTRIIIQRLPAWHETTFAYVIYLIIVITIIITSLYHYSQWKKRKLTNEQINNSAKDLQELVFQLSGNTQIPAPVEGMSLKELLVSMKKILQRQKEQKENSEHTILPEEKSLSISNENFIQKALSYVEKNIDNTDYSVEQLSKDLGMERTGLYRKLGSIIDTTPTSFIRSTRLKRAARLLEEGYTVSEAADCVGFGTSSYLSRCFKEEFGVKPSEYIASLKERRE